MKSLRRGLAILGMALALTGCSGVPSLIGGSSQKILLTQIDQTVKSELPVLRKGSFGRVKILGMTLQSGDKGSGSLEIPVKFVLTSYEIPEGIEGLVVYKGSLRYDPQSRALYPSALQAMRMSFANPSLQEYVSASARKAIPALVASAIQSLAIYRFPEGFQARQLKRAALEKETLLVDFD